MKQRLGLAAAFAMFAAAAGISFGQAVRVDIPKWPKGWGAAVSLTFDDGSANQFKVAVPIMDRLALLATFHIVTGEVAGSKYHGTFVGRPISEIVKETAVRKTGPANFFERASAVGYTGLADGKDYHERAGELYEDGKKEEAYRLIDNAYAKVRKDAVAPTAAGRQSPPQEGILTWDALRALAEHGYEISSHTVTHARLAVLDNANLAYELEKSREDIRSHLGAKHTFTVECPYGTEDERAVAAALRLYPASRNRLPDAFVDQIDRGGAADPAASAGEYVQWQRGVLTATPMAEMKGWVETALSRDNIWLVLVFHGVDGVGWEPRTGAELEDYFAFIASKRTDRIMSRRRNGVGVGTPMRTGVWVATFQDVVKYMRERMRAEVTGTWEDQTLKIDLRHPLDAKIYDLPLTLEICVPEDWTAVEVRQGTRVMRRLPLDGEAGGRYVTVEIRPNAGPAFLTRLKD